MEEDGNYVIKMSRCRKPRDDNITNEEIKMEDGWRSSVKIIKTMISQGQVCLYMRAHAHSFDVVTIFILLQCQLTLTLALSSSRHFPLLEKTRKIWKIKNSSRKSVGQSKNQNAIEKLQVEIKKHKKV